MRATITILVWIGGCGQPLGLGKAASNRCGPAGVPLGLGSCAERPWHGNTGHDAVVGFHVPVFHPPPAHSRDQRQQNRPAVEPVCDNPRPHAKEQRGDHPDGNHGTKLGGVLPVISRTSGRAIICAHRASA